MDETSVDSGDSVTYSSISTPCGEKSLSDFSHLFKTPPRFKEEATASPPSFSNIVLKTFHNSKIDLNVLFNILPIITISPKEIEKRMKENPSNNYNQIFISIRKFPKARGYRKVSKIKSFIDMDFYFLNRPFHIKVSNDKLTIVGGGDMDISKNLIETIYFHFKTLNDKWMSFKDLDRKKTNEIFLKFMNNVDESELLPDELDFYSMISAIIDKNVEDVKERIQDIIPLIGNPLYENEPQLNSLVNCNSVYTYRLPEQVCLAEKASILHKKGYKVMFHNSIFVKCLKAIWVDPVTNKKFKFSIQNMGTVHQNSSNTHEESVEMYVKIIKDLEYIPYQEGRFYANKAKPKSYQNIEKNESCIGILNNYFSIES